MARKRSAGRSSSKSGSIALKQCLIVFGAAGLAAVVVGLIVIGRLSSVVPASEDDVLSGTYPLAVVVGFVLGGGAPGFPCAGNGNLDVLDLTGDDSFDLGDVLSLVMSLFGAAPPLSLDCIDSSPLGGCPEHPSCP